MLAGAGAQSTCCFATGSLITTATIQLPFRYMLYNSYHTTGVQLIFSACSGPFLPSDACFELAIYGLTEMHLHLLHVLYCTGPSKSVVLVDENGTEEEVVFDNKRDFELWAADNTIRLSLADGRKKYIRRWEGLQDGGRYYTTRTLEKTVRGLNAYAVVQ